MTDRLAFFAPCPRGVEALLADELRRLRVRGVRPQRAGVLFSGSIADAYRVLLWSRLASRVLLSLGDVPATSADELYAGVTAMPWEDHLRATGTLAVDATGVNDALRNTQFTAVKVKDAIADRFRARFARRPSVDTRRPDLRVNVVVRDASARISIDLSGDPLHRRGYREPGTQVAAPMKETLAAAVLEIAGWRDIAQNGGGFLDPMCGSGTLAIEAALMAGGIAPGLTRSQWGFLTWLGHDAEAWERANRKARERREEGLATLPPIAASDYDESALAVARGCIHRAGLEPYITVARRSAALIEPPSSVVGLVACNPPYGERLSERAHLPELYSELGGTLRARFDGWTLAVISPDEHLAAGLGMRATRVHELYNGRILAPVSVFGVGSAMAAPEQPAGRKVDDDRRRGPAAPFDATAAPDAGAQAFANRLRKMAKHYGQWARRTGVTCYRVYDADLPDYNLAVDIYAGAGVDEGRRFVHLAEYAAPGEVDPERASQRLEWAQAAAAEVLGVEPFHVFVKRRERQRGTAQYERMGKKSITSLVAENGLTFEVNLSDYLDTGLFLDHRDTRAWIRESAAGTRFLNLFAYTGTASVYAADGGAQSTTTVDLSATYLEWAGRNMAHNGFTGAEHERVQADVLRWIDGAIDEGRTYDLIFCDPPTFSNSKRMDTTWDVQRDHAALIIATAKLLAPQGTLIFSCNRRKFTLETDVLAKAGLEVRDVTRRTIPKDFERVSAIHSCWTVRKA